MSATADHDPAHPLPTPRGEQAGSHGARDHDAAREAAHLAPARDPHVCPACGSDLVAPIAWRQASPGHWGVTLRCPNCEWIADDVLSEEAVARLDEELDRATESIVRDLQRLTRANMEDEIDRFLGALYADQIWPMDF